MRAVEIEGAFEKTEDTTVDEFDADEPVEALEFVLESVVTGDSDRSPRVVLALVQSHFLDD